MVFARSPQSYQPAGYLNDVRANGSRIFYVRNDLCTLCQTNETIPVSYPSSSSVFQLSAAPDLNIGIEPALASRLMYEELSQQNKSFWFHCRKIERRNCLITECYVVC